VVDRQSAVSGESDGSFILFGELLKEIGEGLKGLLDGLRQFSEAVLDGHEGFEILLEVQTQMQSRVIDELHDQDESLDDHPALLRPLSRHGSYFPLVVLLVLLLLVDEWNAELLPVHLPQDLPLQSLKHLINRRAFLYRPHQHALK
jgi:hypothetical protein